MIAVWHGISMPNALFPDMARFPCQPMPKLIRKEVLGCIIGDFEKPVGTEFHAKLCSYLARDSMPKCVGTTCLGRLLELLERPEGFGGFKERSRRDQALNA